MKIDDILDTHAQLRQYSCFQMAPELALKLAGLLGPSDFPFQAHSIWDGRGYEPFSGDHVIGSNRIEFEVKTYDYPYDGMVDRFQKETGEGRYPVVSLRSAPGQPWHGYVVFGRDPDGDLLVMTKIGSVAQGQCHSHVGKLDPHLVSREKADCLFWRSVPI